MRAHLGEKTVRPETGPTPGATAGPGGPKVQPTVARAFAALDRSGVSWALLRGEAELGAPAGDVDILCDRADLPRLEAALLPLGFGRLRTYGRGSHSFFLAYDGADDCWIKLDVVTDLSFGRYQELRLDAVAGCLERRRRVGRLTVLSADDAFWTLLLHHMLDPGTFSRAHRRALRELAVEASTEGSLAPALERVLSGGGYVTALLELTQAGDWTGLERLAPAVRAAWVRGRSRSVWARAVRNAFLRRAARLPPLCRSGLIIRTVASDSALASAVAGRWCLPHRLLGLGESRADAIRGLMAARWHAARGRLVVLDVPEPSSVPVFLDRLGGVRDFRSVVDVNSTRSLADAVARIWRLYLDREHA